MQAQQVRRPYATKRCTRCKERKPLKVFNKSARGPDGYSWQCKRCLRECSGQKPVEDYVRSVMRFIRPTDY